MTRRHSLLVTVLVAVVVPMLAASSAGAADGRLKRQLDAIVNAKAGPPGGIVTLRRGSRLTVVRSGVSEVGSRRRPRASDYMRIASVAKAFSGAVALRLVADGRLSLESTIGGVLPTLPAAWSAVTLRQLLNHTSGVPDYTRSAGFSQQLTSDPGGFVSPQTIIGWVAADPLVFPPGSSYTYSNTDNIVVALMAESATGEPYGRLLREIVYEPLGLRQTRLPISTPLPRPFIHGYEVDGPGPPDDVSTLISPSGAWSSGGIVSTPRNLSTFIRGYVGGRLFPAAQKREQLRFVAGGASVPPGPGTISAGLGVFRYRTKCGTVYGHTGTFPGYVQFAAATRNGRRAVTSSLSFQAPDGRLLGRLRAMQRTAVCMLLR